MIDEKVLSGIGVSPDDTAKWVPPLNMAMLKYNMDTPQRQAMFLAQCAHESGNFKFVVENLNYSTEALMRVFRKYFPNEDLAQAYARQPERIANYVYADRMGNGDWKSGDGWRFRGRGLIQLTGRNNYALFSMHAENDALMNPDIVATPEYAAESAGWFWNINRLNRLADTGDVRAVTRRVNGGFNGLADRQLKYDKILALLEAAP